MSADLALAADPSVVERAADPAVFIVQACERAKAWLREVLDHGDIEQIVEIKSQAEAVRVYTMQKNLGKDAELAAAEIVRRAERGIGVAIRRGQEDGEIETTLDARSRASRIRHGLHRDNNAVEKRPYTDFASRDELTGNDAGILHMTDEVPDEDFEASIAQAKGERNLSRANVVRKIRSRARGPQGWIPGAADRSADAVGRRRELIRDLATAGYSSRQIREQIGTGITTIRQIARDCGIDIPADKIVGRTRLVDSNRVVRETVSALEGLAMGVELIDPDDLDVTEAANWAASLTDSIRVLNRLIKTLKGTAQ